MGKRPKPPVDKAESISRNKEKTEYYDYASNRLNSPKPGAANKAKTTSYNVRTYGEAKPVDERGFGRVSKRETAPVKKKTRGGPGQNRTRPNLTPQQMNQLQKNKQAVGAGKNKPAPGKGNPKKPIPMPRAIERKLENTSQKGFGAMPGGKTPAQIAVTTPEQMKQKRATGLNALRKTKPVMPRRGGR